MGRTALFRASAGVQIGTGHVMRSLALAQAWKDKGGDAVLLTGPGATDADKWWLNDRFTVEHLTAQIGGSEDTRATVQAAHRFRAEWLVLDGFDFPEAYQRAVRDSVLRQLVIDDHALLAHYHADIIVNHNVFADAQMYKDRADGTELLLGLHYSLLRRQFRNLHVPKRPFPQIARRVLVTMGGSDPQNVSLRVVEALKRSRVQDLHVTVLLGAANPHRETFEGIANDLPFALTVREKVRDMVAAIMDAEAVISAGGGTCAELALLRVPMLLLTIAENHAQTVEEYGRQCLAVAGGWSGQCATDILTQRIDSFLCDRNLRQEIASRAASYVDGQGAARIADRMLELSW